MAASSGGEKTEKPTPKKKKDSRKEGQIARTADLGAWLSVLAALWLGPIAIKMAYEQCREMLTGIGDVFAGGEGDLLAFLGTAVLGGALAMAPLVLITLLIGVGSQIAQIGWAPKKLKFDIKKLNLFKGIKGMFGMKMVWDSFKNLGKLAVIVVLGIGPVEEVYSTLWGSGTGMSVPAMAGVIAQQSIAFLRNVALAGLVLAAGDYWASKKQTDKQVKMTKQEVKDEHKQSEGDPQLKGQIRQRQMAMSRNRMMAEVPKADVILVNPTHIAVALRYDPMVGAPVVLAKGAGVVADRIRELAAESSIPVVRDVPLARTVYRLVDIGHQIPTELYEAIARVLAFVYALRAKGRAAGMHDSPFEGAHEGLTALEKQRRRRKTPVTVS